ncbi:MAG: uroporphyrinogen decarboxylase [Methylococcales bacterium]|nr:uroporphyrinogen decarboxylase [Methylococcales bacterium]MBT7410536.1 uroporphyrinogen decarboxylase [Methylococcales bacterium]
MTNKNPRFINSLLKKPVDATPIWIMRQAGRYLPEYRASRQKAGNFLTLCKTPELACEVTLQPLQRFDLDAAILFSDILTIPDAMGQDLYFKEGEGPGFNKVIRSKKDVDQLLSPDPESELKYVMDAVRLIHHELDNKVPLIGFAGSPWTLSTYMIEGGATKTFQQTKSMMFNEPDVLHLLLEKLSQSVVQYLIAQIEAGVEAVMIFDTWGGILNPQDYREFSLKYMSLIVDKIKKTATCKQVPIILFTKGGGHWVKDIVGSGCDAIGVDWTVNLSDIKKQVGDKVALQGNLDPCVLYASPEVIQQKAGEILEQFGHGSGHVFNLGHGVHPDMNPEHIAALVDAVHELSRKYHL